MALGWNGDGAVVAKKPRSTSSPEEGGEFWVDSYAIPVGAKNPDAAHAWINYVYDPEINALETEYTYYGSPLKRRAPGRDRPEGAREQGRVPGADARQARAEQRVAEGTQLRERIWTEFKSA